MSVVIILGIALFLSELSFDTRDSFYGNLSGQSSLTIIAKCTPIYAFKCRVGVLLAILLVYRSTP